MSTDTPKVEPYTAELPQHLRRIASEGISTLEDLDRLENAADVIASLLAENALLRKERDGSRERASQLQSTAKDLIRQRDAAMKDRTEIREMLDCTEDDDDFLGALRALRTRAEEALARIHAMTEDQAREIAEKAAAALVGRHARESFIRDIILSVINEVYGDRGVRG